MPPVIATASGLFLFGLLSLFGGVRGMTLGIAWPLMRGVDCVGLDARLGFVRVALDARLGILDRCLGLTGLGRDLRLRDGLGRNFLGRGLSLALREDVLGQVDLRRRSRSRGLQRLPVGARLHVIVLV